MAALVWSFLKKTEFDLVLCDFRLEDTDGREMLKNIKALYPKTGVIIITGYSDIKMAVELLRWVPMIISPNPCIPTRY
jgi:two-component system response regulator HydG